MPYFSVGQIYNLFGVILNKNTNTLYNCLFTLNVTYVAPPGLTPQNPNTTISLNTYYDLDGYDPTNNSYAILNTKTQTIVVFSANIIVTPLQGGPSQAINLGNFCGNLTPRGDSPMTNISDNGVAFGQFIDVTGKGYLTVELQTGVYLFSGKNAIKVLFSNADWQSTTMGFIERS